MWGSPGEPGRPGRLVGTAARIAGGRAARTLARAVPDATESELRLAREAVRSGVEEMPDLLRTGFTLALLVSLVVRVRGLFAVSEVERFGTGLALAALYEARGGDTR